MATLTIELPDDLAQQIQGRGISQQRLEKVVTRLLQEILHEWDEQSGIDETRSTATQSTWSEGAAFARRVIANNRELFEELARL